MKAKHPNAKKTLARMVASYWQMHRKHTDGSRLIETRRIRAYAGVHGLELDAEFSFHSRLMEAKMDGLRDHRTVEYYKELFQNER